MGAVIGWLSGRAQTTPSHALTLENVGVGIFGAFLGGEFVTDMLRGATVAEDNCQFSSLMLAVAGAVVFVVLLKLMHRMVGPMKKNKSRRRNHY